MFVENRSYGHNQVLGLYSGFKTPPPIWGMLQHGWNLGTGFSPYHPPRGIRLFVWNSHNLDTARAAGLSKVSAIGAPFLYLVKYRSARVSVDAQGTIAYPFHSWERGDVVGDHAAYAREIAAREAAPVTICLYWREYDHAPVRQLYEETGARVICHGRRYDGDFLLRQLGELMRHRRVVTNRVGTALWYGAALGLELEVYGPTMGIRKAAEGFEFDRLQRVRWPQLFGRALPGPGSVELADRELGSAHVQAPDQLLETFGWGRLHRAFGTVLQKAVWTAQILKPHLSWPRVKR